MLHGGGKICLFWLILLVLPVLVLELGARLLEALSPGNAPVANTLVPDPIFHHMWKPNLAYLDTFRAVPYTLYTNSQGWVERYDVQAQKPAGVYRIFFLGDSSVQGVVEPEHKMVEIVEQRLADAFGSRGLRIEAINTGTSSWSIFQYYLMVRHVLSRYAPDLVIICVDMNDVPNDSFYRQFAEFDDKGDPVAVRPNKGDSRGYRLTPFGSIEISRAEALSIVLHRHVALYRLLERQLKGLRPPAPKLALEDNWQQELGANWLAKEWTPEIRGNVEFSMALLRKAIGLLKSRGIRVVVTGVPHFAQFSGAWSSEPHEALRRAALAQGALYLNSYEALRPSMASKPVDAFYWPNDDTHFNIQGNAAWAEALFRFLMENRSTLFE